MDIVQTQGPGGSQPLEADLSLVVDQGGSQPLFPAKTLQTTLSRKFSQRNDRETATDGGAVSSGSAPTVEAAADKFVVLDMPPPPQPAAVSPRQGRRAHTRRAAPWLHPRNVLVFFATLSSLGTVLLLYFTLSTGVMGQGDTDSR